MQGPYNSSTSILSFPGIGPAAAQLLVQRKVAGVGLDTGLIIFYYIDAYSQLIITPRSLSPYSISRPWQLQHLRCTSHSARSRDIRHRKFKRCHRWSACKWRYDCRLAPEDHRRKWRPRKSGGILQQRPLTKQYTWTSIINILAGSIISYSTFVS